MRSSVRARLLVVLSALSAFIPFTADRGLCDPGPEGRPLRSGPAPVVNQAPVQLLFLQAVPDRAQTLPRGAKEFRINTSVTNTLLDQSLNGYSGRVDMEMVRTCLEFQYGIHPRLEGSVSLPLVYRAGGVMDRTILDVEEFFGNARAVREAETPDQFAFYAQQGGNRFLGTGERSSGLGDLALRLKGEILEEQGRLPCVSARVGLKVPTGDEDEGLGSGAFDVGAGLLLQKDLGDFTTYLNADIIVPGDDFDVQGVDVEAFYTFMFGLEYRFTSKLSAIAQTTYTTRPFDGTGLDLLERRIADVLLGVTYLTDSGITIQGGGVEDVYDSVDSGSDISFFFILGKRF